MSLGLIGKKLGMSQIFDKDGKLVRFTGLVIDSQGKVKQLLDRKDKRPERPDFKEDGRGRTLIPGLIDAHTHLDACGAGRLACQDVDGVQGAP